MIRTVSIAAAALVLALLIGSAVMVWVFPNALGSGNQFASCTTTRIVDGSAIGGPFSLVSETGAEVTETDIITKPTLVYFGYTYCPDVCPIDSDRTAQAVISLREQGHDVGNVFVSVDPARDTPEVMTEFTDFFDSEMIGLTGSDDQIAAAAQAYRVYYDVAGEGEDYLVNHSVLTYLVAPDHGVLEILRRDLSIEEMVEKVACFMDEI